SDWPSSTRAEIAAIFLALLTAPGNSNVEIYTDSQCAFDVLSHLHNNSTRKWLKMNNAWFLQKIELLLRTEGISIKMIKVKGHSGIVGNDLADDMANKGADSSRNIYSPHINHSSNLSF